MAILDIVKKDLRIKHAQLDSDIQINIDACKLDLGLAGVSNVSEDDALIQMAIKMYCRAVLNMNDNSEKYQKAYDKLKDALSLSGDYGSVNV